MIPSKVATSLLRPKLFRMATTKNCHNLCTVLRKCLAEEPNVDLLAEKTVSVRCVEDEDKLFISARFDGKSKHYARHKQEPLKNTLGRIHISLVNPNNKKKLRKRAQHDLGPSEETHKYSEDVIVEVKKLQGPNHVKINEETTNIEAWTSGSILVIGTEEFRIKVNAPAVLSVSLPNSLMAGFPIVPNLDLEFANREHSRFMWLRSNDCNKSTVTSKKDKKPVEDCCERNVSWEFVSNKFMYTPTNQDIGYKLKFICIPSRGDNVGFSHEVVSSVNVEAGPGICPFDERHLYTSKQLDHKDEFRVVSYNILADIYCSTEFAQKQLYPYCSSYATEFGYRGQLIMKELLGYNADIICLQECDQKVFEHFLQPVFKDIGFSCYYMRKAGEMPEGEALLFRDAKFSLIKESNVVISEAVHLPCNEYLFAALEGCPELLASLKKRTAIGQILALRDNAEKDRVICMLNTHLYFRPEAANIRLLQIMVLLNCLKDLIDRIKTQQLDQEDRFEVNKVAVLICGDLNSTPDTAVVDFLLNRFIPANHKVWNTAKSEEKSINIDLEHVFQLFSACGFPKFTNYVVGFKDTLDYILADRGNFEVQSCVPLPGVEALSLHTALPSITAPSDHLALICDLLWKEE